MSDKLKNFIVRTLSGAVLLAIVLGASTCFDAYWVLLFVITTIGMWEFYRIAEAVECRPRKALGLASGLMLFGATLLCVMEATGMADVGVAAIAGTALFILLCFAIFAVELFGVTEHPLRNVASTMLGVVYVAVPMAIMTFIPLLLSGGVWAPWYFLFYLFIVWGNDVFAYLVGITLGRHRLCERISPKKSWEGFFGGIAGALGVGAVAAWVLDDSYALWLGLAAVVAVTSVVGDLVESMFKREAGIKDSGNILPGHGGMLDRFDALIYSAPFALVYLVIMELVNML
ncbi:MAG: phosphatidate cytidylyltransferase [Alistipes sp.]|nr:phosphatidate cytidylyltransferase [Alistipes sp.]